MFAKITRKARNTKSNTQCRPVLESLEARKVMTASVVGNGLHVISGADNDTIAIYDRGSYLEVQENGDSSYFPTSIGSITVRSNGGDDTIFNQTDIYSLIYAGDGDDIVISEKSSNFIDGGAGDDVIYTNRGSDYVLGGAGNDTINAGQNVDLLFGGQGDDVLRGGAGTDQLFGGEGDDDLYGGTGVDLLFGSAGDDGLFGGGATDADSLFGGAGSDRFLTHGSSDRVFDEVASEDAVIQYQDTNAHTTTYVGFGPISFAAGQWTDAEIEKTDVALRNLHHHVPGTQLLETANGGRVTFERDGQQQNNGNGITILGGNGGNGNISFTQAVMGSSDIQLYQTIYHEVGHNFDDASENSTIGEFRELSGWTTNPDRDDEGNLETRGLFGWKTKYYASNASGDNWFFTNEGDFARDYGKFNPNEDYATTWETYFADKYHDDTNGRDIVKAKFDVVDKFFESLA